LFCAAAGPEAAASATLKTAAAVVRMKVLRNIEILRSVRF
jgi:hypothetical protein